MNDKAIPRSLFFLAGAASGLALGYYLFSEDGGKLREQFRENWDKLLQNIAGNTQEQVQALLQNLNAALEKSLDLVDLQNGEPEASEPDDDFDLLEDAAPSFETGMKKARAELSRKLALAGFNPED